MTALAHEASRAEERTGRPRTRWLLAVVVGLVAAAVGLGAGYLLFAPDPGADVDADVEALLDDFYAAVNEGDIEAIQEMSVEDARILGVPVTSGSTLAGSLENLVDSAGGVSRLGDPIVDESGFIFHVAQLTELANSGDDFIWLFDVVGTDEQLEIVGVEPWVGF